MALMFFKLFQSIEIQYISVLATSYFSEENMVSRKTPLDTVVKLYYWLKILNKGQRP